MYKSESVKNLAKALSALQGELQNPKNTQENPYFKSKYAPLNEILAQIRPLLAKYGISIVQIPSGDGTNISVSTLLMHESGEWIETDPLVVRAEKQTAQGAGSAITYARRYSLSAVLGISSEDDDDGNLASDPSQEKTKQNQKAEQKNKASQKTITKAMRDKLFAMLKEAGIAEVEYQKAFIEGETGKKSTKDLTYDEIQTLYDKLDILIQERRQKK